MIARDWSLYRQSLGNPPSLTSTDDARRAEAATYIAQAVAGVEKSARLLVLGCGDGYELELLKQAGYEDVTGVVCVEGEFEAAIAKGLRVYMCDIHELTTLREVNGEGPFDMVISKETLEHMVAPYIALWQINAMLKPGGRFVHYIPAGAQKQRDWYHQHCCPDWWWADLFLKTGFEVDGITFEIEQNRYEGRKVRDFDPDWRLPLYDPDGYLAERRR